jgi:hypothetical protein
LNAKGRMSKRASRAPSDIPVILSVFFQFIRLINAKIRPMLGECVG